MKCPLRLTVSMLIVLCSHVSAALAGDDHRPMAIEQVIAGVNGARGAQAIQLLVRACCTDFAGARLVVYDASGQNGLMLAQLESDPPNKHAGARFLFATPQFVSLTGITPDSQALEPIPGSYLNAGRIVLERNETVWWSLSYGGAAYTGPTEGSIFNDLDGDFGPSFAGPLPFTSTHALAYLHGNSASDSNATDYALTQPFTTFTNNSGQSVTLAPPITITGWRTVLDHGNGLGPLSLTHLPDATNQNPAHDPRDTPQLRLEVDFSGPASGISLPLRVSAIHFFSDVYGARLEDGGTRLVMPLPVNTRMADPSECYRINLGFGIPNLTGDTDLHLRWLIGDTNNDGQVSLIDVLQIKSRVGQPVLPDNVALDVNRDGAISLIDTQLVKSRVGRFLSCVQQE